MAAQPAYAPSFTVRIGGEALPTAMRAAISSLRHQDGIEGADRVELTLLDEHLQWLGHPLLRTDRRLELDVGYAPHPLETVFVGEITGLEASYPASGVPTVTVVAHDFLQRLTIGEKDRAWLLSVPCIGKFPLPDNIITGIVAATNGLIPAVDPVSAALSFLGLIIAYALDPIEAMREVRIQKGQSDFDFLTGLAKENGWELFIDHTLAPRGHRLRLLFPLGDRTPSATLKWGESLIDFTPRLTTVGQVGAIATRIWVSAIGMEFVVLLGWDFDRAAFDLQVYPGFGDIDALSGAVAKRGVLRVEALGPASAPKTLLREFLPKLNNRLTGSGTTIGDTAIKAGQMVAIDGIGGEFPGLYRVTSATHTIDGGGFRTAFDVRKEVWFDSVPVPKGLRAQGQRVF
jgi:phage protein D